MRRDVLSLIVGWTMVAMLIPLSFSFLVTWWLDGLNTAGCGLFDSTVIFRFDWSFHVEYWS